MVPRRVKRKNHQQNLLCGGKINSEKKRLFMTRIHVRLKKLGFASSFKKNLTDKRIVPFKV
jgi:hypothetical protein